MCTAMENIVVVRLNVVQNSAVQFAGSSDSEPPVLIKERNARSGLGVEATIAPDLEAHEGAPAIIHLSPI
jgi:hypothetical protein